jgi:hypothetical protein
LDVISIFEEFLQNRKSCLLLIINLNFFKMKKALFFSCLLFIVAQFVSAQTSNKTNLSLQVSSAVAANRAQLKSYVWTRTIQVFSEGLLKTTIVSSMSVGPDGKMVATAVSNTPAEPLPGGIRGNIAKKKIAEIKAYVDDAVQISAGYIYMSKGKMVDYFDNGSISQSGNTITVNGTNAVKPNDQFTMNLTAGTLAFVSLNIKSTTTSGDAMTETCNYKTFSNGLTAFNDGELDLPAKSMKLMITNSNYAKKLQ